jgi:VanZ family protein
VVWSQDGLGLKFKRNSLVVSNAALQPPGNDDHRYTIELLLRPAATTVSNTILGFYSHSRPTQLVVRQYHDGLLVTHDGHSERDPSRKIKFDADHIFNVGRFVQLTISSGTAGTTVFVDGQLAERIPTFKISRDELAGEIVVGTSPISHSLWTGDLRGLAIYSKELTAADALQHYKEWTEQSGNFDRDAALARYNFSEGAGSEIHDEVASGPKLEVPEAFSVPHKGFLLSPIAEFTPDRNYVVDILVNIAGFIPLGVIVCAYLLWIARLPKAIMLAAVACGLLSLTIEILQYFIPPRGSGITDVITNSLGGLIGAMLLRVDLVRSVMERVKLVPPSRRRG